MLRVALRGQEFLHRFTLACDSHERLIGIEQKVWVQVQGYAKVWPIADEDLERETEDKTSAVHFLRFELTPDMIRAVKGGAPVAMGIDHDAYRHAIDAVPRAVRDSLAQDLRG